MWAAAGRLEKSFSKLAEQSVKQLCECISSFFFSFKVYTPLNFLSSGLFVLSPFQLGQLSLHSKRSRKWLQILHVFWPQQTVPWKPLLAPSTFSVTARKEWVSQVFYMLKYTADEENRRYFNTLSSLPSSLSFPIWDFGRSPSVRWWGPNIRHRDGGPSRVSTSPLPNAGNLAGSERFVFVRCTDGMYAVRSCRWGLRWCSVISAEGFHTSSSGGNRLQRLRETTAWITWARQ